MKYYRLVRGTEENKCVRTTTVFLLDWFSCRKVATQL